MAKGPKKPVVGMDMGGTKILAGVVDDSGKIFSTSKRSTKAYAGPDEVIERMAKTVREAVEDAGLKMSDIQAVGSGAPGPLDPDEGIIWHTPNLPGWDNIPLAALLEESLGVPVYIDNDVNMGTLGEFALGAARARVTRSASSWARGSAAGWCWMASCGKAIARMPLSWATWLCWPTDRTAAAASAGAPNRSPAAPPSNAISAPG